MEVPYPHISVIGAFSTSEPLPAIPELEDYAYFDQNAGRYDETGTVKAQLRVRLHEIPYSEVFAVFQQHSLPVIKHNLTVMIEDAFWQCEASDVVGATLQSDGYVKLPAGVSPRKLIPISNRFYIAGRPEFDAEHQRGKPHLINTGGIPIVSDKLLETLEDMNAEGTRADVIYRGHNKANYDTVQPAFQRFLPEPKHQFDSDEVFDILPATLSSEFGICSVLRQVREDSRYEIAMSAEKAAELRRRRRTVQMNPIFQRNGLVHGWLSGFKDATAGMKQ